MLIVDTPHRREIWGGEVLHDSTSHEKLREGLPANSSAHEEHYRKQGGLTQHIRYNPRIVRDWLTDGTRIRSNKISTDFGLSRLELPTFQSAE